MRSLWSDSQAEGFAGDLGKRVYTSRLLGADPELVLHGGGNTSVKVRETDFFGESTEILYVKGSGWDLATIEAAGFAPVRMKPLLQMAEMPHLSDADMVKQQRAAMLDPEAPNPSIEAILHAILPFRFVDHTHANAIIALTNSPRGEERVRGVFGGAVLVVPYVMPGFILARTVWELIRGRDLAAEGIRGIILMNHGIFTFADDARTSYETMIDLVSQAEAALAAAGARLASVAPGAPDLLGLAELRGQVSRMQGAAMIARLDASEAAVGYAALPNISDLATRGPATPDHSIRTKRIPAVLGEDRRASLEAYAAEYAAYFGRHATGQTMLDPAPRVVIWPGQGVVSFGRSVAEADAVLDIARATWETVQKAEMTGGWQALSEKDIFEVEYWDLEQAKLRKGGQAKVHQGKVALVTGSAAGIGFACAEALAMQGAKVIGLDLSEEIVAGMASLGGVGKVVNLTNDAAVLEAVEGAVREFGGIDILVSNAGIFTAGQYLDQLAQENWDKSMAVNLTSHQKLLKYTIPYLKHGIDPAIVLVGSRNVQAPGAGAASYSCAKAALTQLCRVAALELAPVGVRCNIIHPDAVFDTKLWTPENLARSAERYGMTVEEYKSRNLLRTEIKSRDVGAMVAAMASPLFGKTTGAQIPVDGGNDRVI
ncbi:MAG: Rhamnose utilization protein RhaD [Verrucomicrobia bacterium]|jgi:rhamnose utilization protein RhaD (predicted bifunctional aldolase and dehydrogenase)/NAD(P)-dependent dehydrogenase (short-subunit alcohol dehydrogenase family)|nr:MAG: Rhamnose utilization protein RhaD [Verrucomicrobiota bacterium]